MTQDERGGKRVKRVLVVGGESSTRRAVLAAAEEAGVAAETVADQALVGRDGDAVVDLGLPPHEWDPRTLADAEVARVREVLQRAKECARLVRVSVIGASKDGEGELQRAAAAVEDALCGAAVSSASLRVGVVLGDCGVAAVFRQWIERSKLLLLPGIDRVRLEPLALGDLARYCVAAATADRSLDQAYDLSCGEMLTGGLLVSGLADNLGLSRWCLPAPPVAGHLVAAFGSDDERPRAAVALWLDALAIGRMPRGTRAWEHFDVQPVSLREAMAEAAGMLIPLRRRGEGKFENWRAPQKKGILWTRGSSGRKR